MRTTPVLVAAATVTRPWTMRVAERRRLDEELWESACYEGAVNPDEFLIKNTPAQK